MNTIGISTGFHITGAQYIHVTTGIDSSLREISEQVSRIVIDSQDKALQAGLVQLGWIPPEDTWTAVSDELPPDETPVLCVVHGYDQPLILERRWDYPTYEETYPPYWYWDDPQNDGQDYADSVIAWRPLPDLPSEKSI